MDGIGNTHDNEGPFTRHREARIGCIQASARCLLNLTDPSTTLTNNRANENMWDQETQRVRLGCSRRGLTKRFVVEGTNDQTEGLRTLVKVFRGIHPEPVFTLATASTIPLTVRMRSTAPF